MNGMPNAVHKVFVSILGSLESSDDGNQFGGFVNEVFWMRSTPASSRRAHHQPVSVKQTPSPDTGRRGHCADLRKAAGRA